MYLSNITKIFAVYHMMITLFTHSFNCTCNPKNVSTEIVSQDHFPKEVYCGKHSLWHWRVMIETISTIYVVMHFKYWHSKMFHFKMTIGFDQNKCSLLIIELYDFNGPTRQKFKDFCWSLLCYGLFKQFVQKYQSHKQIILSHISKYVESARKFFYCNRQQ